MNLLNLLYVPKCLSCGGYVKIDEYLCKDCMCKWWYERSNVNQDSLFLAYYDKNHDNVMRSIIIKIKNSNEKRSYQFLADEFYDKLKNYTDHIITNVPRAKGKIAEIGHDQVKLFAKAVAYKMKIKYQGFLIHKGNQEQKLLDISERRSNAENSFDIKAKYRNESKLRGLKILLADDVMATGSTLDKCKRLLIENGADDVETITICRTK